MNTDTENTIVAYCGLICSKCGAFIKGKCQGCHSEKPMFKNCPVKKCNIEKQFSTCSDCTDFSELKNCKKLNNWISKIIGFIFKTNRIANLCKIKEIGFEKFKAEAKSQ